MPSQSSPCRSSPVLRFSVILLALCSPGPLRAQGQPAPPLARAEQLAEKHELVEAEKAYLEAIAECEKQIGQRPGDVSCRLELFHCQGQLAGVRVEMCKFAQAKAGLLALIAALEQLSGHNPQEPAFRLELGKAHRRLGLCFAEADLSGEAAVSLGKAIEVLRVLATALPRRLEPRAELTAALTDRGSALVNLGRHAEAEACFHEAQQHGRQIVADPRHSSDHLAQFRANCSASALLLRNSGRIARAIEVLHEGIRAVAQSDRPQEWRSLIVLYRDLAQPLLILGDQDGNRIALREADRLEARLAKVPGAREKLLTDEDKLVGRIRGLDAAGLVQQQPDVGRLLQEAEKKARAYPDVPLYQARLAQAKGIRAIRLNTTGSFAEGAPAFAEAVALFTQLTSSYPDVPKYRMARADSTFSCGLTYLVARKPAEAEKYLREGNDLLAKLADDYPQTARFRHSHAHLLSRVVTMKTRQGNYAEAARDMAPALAVAKKLAADFPTCAEYRRQPAQGHVTLGTLLNGAGLSAEAEASFREACRLWAANAADFPASVEFRVVSGDMWSSLGQYLAKRDRAREAEEAFAEAMRIHQGVLRDFPQEAGYHIPLANDYFMYAKLLKKQDRDAAAHDACSRSIYYLETALKLSPHRRDWLANLQATLRERAVILRELNKWSDYERDLRRANEVGERLETPFMRLSRARERFEEANYGRARQDADELFQDDDLSGAQWYELAQLYAALSQRAGEAAGKESAAALAVRALGKALEAGHVVVEPLTAERAFRDLVGRADFRAVVAMAPK